MKIGLTGHRGSGKTTELMQLKNSMDKQFFPLYLSLSNYVLRDCNCIDILVWLVESTVRRFSGEKWPIDSTIVINITDWFASKCFNDADVVKEEIRSEVGTDYRAQYGIYWLPVLLLNRIKSMMVASSDQRQTIRKTLYTYTDEMVHRVNCLLDEARATLRRIDKGNNLLIILDNLDHIPSGVARNLFFDSAEIIHSLRAHIVFTFPISLHLPPYSIADNFSLCYNLPFVQIHKEDSSVNDTGINGLTEVARKRLDLKKYFKSFDLVKGLAIASGGNLRDWFALLQNSLLAAKVCNQSKIDQGCCDISIQKLSANYEKLLIPTELMYPILFRIETTRSEYFMGEANFTSSGVHDARFFGDELFSSGAINETAGTKPHYQLHPAVNAIRSYREYAQSQVPNKKYS
ncbi:MAG: hypothetical protein K0U54_04230 [Bacteroidetes bacterium]|nr:hypothetical protein [Bacteroidota bacterium]